jgi:hypothetical protein
MPATPNSPALTRPVLPRPLRKLPHHRPQTTLMPMPVVSFKPYASTPRSNLLRARRTRSRSSC